MGPRLLPGLHPCLEAAHRWEGCSQKATVTVTELCSLKQLGVVAWAILQPLGGHLELVQDWNLHLVGRPCQEYIVRQAWEGRSFLGQWLSLPR